MRKRFVITLSLVLLSSTPISASGEKGVYGEWLAGNGKTQIKTFPCVEGGNTICSVITWLKNPRKDANNENPALRKRDLIGVEVGKDMKPDGKNRWVGEVYSSKRGKYFQSTASLKDDVLMIKGCLTRAKIACKTQVFNRIEVKAEDNK